MTLEKLSECSKHYEKIHRFQTILDKPHLHYISDGTMAIAQTNDSNQPSVDAKILENFRHFLKGELERLKKEFEEM
jgi:hypothetical protein